MFWKRKEGEEKLPGPKEIPAPVQKNLIDEKKMDTDLVRQLLPSKAAIRRLEKVMKDYAGSERSG